MPMPLTLSVDPVAEDEKLTEPNDLDITPRLRDREMFLQ
jgi:hypothetical protein